MLEPLVYSFLSYAGMFRKFTFPPTFIIIKSYDFWLLSIFFKNFNNKSYYFFSLSYLTFNFFFRFVYNFFKFNYLGHFEITGIINKKTLIANSTNVNTLK